MSPKKKPNPQRKVTRRKFMLGTAAVLGGTALWQKDSADRLTIERHTLNLPRWDADGFKIALLTDMHMTQPHSVQRGIDALRMAEAEKPDAICLLGDYVHGDNTPVVHRLEEFLKACEDVNIPLYGILGNHDYWAHEPDKIIAALDHSRIHLLRNETAEVGGVIIHGIDDGIAGRDKHDRLSATQDKNVLALFHEPDFVERVDKRISLMVSGHSHGGQVCLPGGVHLHTPRGARTYVRGEYRDSKVPLYVSRGVGTIGIPYRVFCPPEVSILTLKGA